MKGVVFSMLGEMLEQQFGLELWDELLEKAKPASGGVYISGETYPDEEMLGLVQTLSEMTDTPIPDLLFAFGEFSLDFFAKNYGSFFEGLTAKEFLSSVEDVIHVEVKKLYPGAGVPTFQFEDPAPNQLVMIYHSPRKLYDYAKGLISGTGKHYNQPLDIKMNIYEEAGEEYCRYDLTFG